MTADDERRAEIEAVAREANPAYDAATHDLTRAVWRREAERYMAALDRVRDARGDDEALLEATKREAACGRELAAAHARIAELEASRFPQGEDHEAAWRVVASMPHATYAVLKPVICALGGQIESAARSPQGEDHEHEWVDARNEAVVSGEVCLGCGAVRASPRGRP